MRESRRVNEIRDKRNSRCARDSQCIMRDSREMHSRCAALYTKRGSIRSPIFLPLPVPAGMPITVDDTTAAIIITAQRRGAFHAQPPAHTLDTCGRRSLGRSCRGLLRGGDLIGRRLVIGFRIGHVKKDRTFMGKNLFHRHQHKIIEFFADFLPEGHVLVEQCDVIFVVVANF